VRLRSVGQLRAQSPPTETSSTSPQSTFSPTAATYAGAITAEVSYATSGIDLAPPGAGAPSLSWEAAYAVCQNGTAQCEYDAPPTITLAGLTLPLAGKSLADVSIEPLARDELAYVLTWTGSGCTAGGGGPSAGPGETPEPVPSSTDCMLMNFVDADTGNLIYAVEGPGRVSKLQGPTAPVRPDAHARRSIRLRRSTGWGGGCWRRCSAAIRCRHPNACSKVRALGGVPLPGGARMCEYSGVTGMTNMNPSSTTVLWQGTSSDLASVASGGRVASASYVVTEDAVKFASGMLSTREEQIPLWVIRDCDLNQSLGQKARGVGDLTLKIDPSYASTYGQVVLVLKSIKDAASVRDVIVRQANTVRAYWAQHHHDREVERQRAGASNLIAPTAPPPAAAAPADDLMSRLAKLGEMKLAGLLTDDEFTAAKAKLLA
jgi:hypothetical protein